MMELTISGEFAQKLIGLLKKDKALAQSMAADWVERVDPPAMAAYLLTPEVAVQLLASRLVSEPGRTLEELSALAAARGSRRKRGQAAARKGKQEVAAPQRRRLTARQIAGLKKRIVAFLGGVQAASRKQIIEAARVPTPALYNRVMGELREEGLVASEGIKARAVYFLAKKVKRSAKKGAKK